MRLVRHWHRLPRVVSLPASVQGQFGWVFEQAGLVEGVLGNGRGVGTR